MTSSACQKPKTKTILTPQSRCRVGLARADITPPIGIYHRMWGAAMHDQAEAVHRPLYGSLLWLEPLKPAGDERQLLFALDHCVIDNAEMLELREAVASGVGIAVDTVSITLSHTHGSAWLARSRAHLPGGDKIGPYLDRLKQQMVELAQAARANLAPATICYGQGRCNLAGQRDYWDEAAGAFVCGYNPDGVADDTLLVARITDEAGATRATLVNYACHPTTLAWENRALSPDWVGAMRETVEAASGGICFFMQGASGELGPVEGYVGDLAVADRNGRQVGYAAASALETVPKPGTRFVYAGPVVSGALLGSWKHESLDSQSIERQATWRWEHHTVNIAYRAELPTLEQTVSDKATFEVQERAAHAAGDTALERDYHAKVEQMTRQIMRLKALPEGKSYPLPVTIGLLGDAIWLWVPGEHYQLLQTELRQRFAPRPVIVATLTNSWQPGYLPQASSCGYGIYQDIISPVAPGGLEVVIESVTRFVRAMLQQ